MISPETGMTPLQHYLTLSIIDLLNNYKYSSTLSSSRFFAYKSFLTTFEIKSIKHMK